VHVHNVDHVDHVDEDAIRLRRFKNCKWPERAEEYSTTIR